jgi:hypothetical protein
MIGNFVFGCSRVGKIRNFPKSKKCFVFRFEQLQEDYSKMNLEKKSLFYF